MALKANYSLNVQMLLVKYQSTAVSTSPIRRNKSHPRRTQIQNMHPGLSQPPSKGARCPREWCSPRETEPQPLLVVQDGMGWRLSAMGEATNCMCHSNFASRRVKERLGDTHCDNPAIPPTPPHPYLLSPRQMSRAIALWQNEGLLKLTKTGGRDRRELQFYT